jgi:nucleoside-diphosphate-sugar epimerase
LARCLIIGCGCRGRLLAASLVADGHQVRGTTRDHARCADIEAAGAEAMVADPDRVATLVGSLRQVTVAVILLGSAVGSRDAITALHGPRLDMLLTKLVDTTVRAVVYEATGRVDAAVLAGGAQRVREYAHRSHAGFRLLEADPAQPAEWLAAARNAVGAALTAR